MRVPEQGRAPVPAWGPGPVRVQEPVFESQTKTRLGSERMAPDGPAVPDESAPGEPVPGDAMTRSEEELRVGKVVNCTGPDTDLGRVSDDPDVHASVANGVELPLRDRIERAADARRAVDGGAVGRVERDHGAVAG